MNQIENNSLKFSFLFLCLDIANHSEATMMVSRIFLFEKRNLGFFFQPYYDSPYDYYYGGGQVSQYQYLHQSHLNKNNNNSLSAETLTAITPNLATSVYTLHLSSMKSSLPIQRRCERRLSSPAIITTALMNENSIKNIDTFV
jgi:hypothetical protein